MKTLNDKLSVEFIDSLCPITCFLSITESGTEKIIGFIKKIEMVMNYDDYNTKLTITFPNIMRCGVLSRYNIGFAAAKLSKWGATVKFEG